MDVCGCTFRLYLTHLCSWYCCWYICSSHGFYHLLNYSDVRSSTCAAEVDGLTQLHSVKCQVTALCVCVCFLFVSLSVSVCTCLCHFFSPPPPTLHNTNRPPTPPSLSLLLGLINVHHDTLMKRQSSGANGGEIQQGTLCLMSAPVWGKLCYSDHALPCCHLGFKVLQVR